jgi:hypothetical protein
MMCHPGMKCHPGTPTRPPGRQILAHKAATNKNHVEQLVPPLLPRLLLLLLLLLLLNIYVVLQPGMDPSAAPHIRPTKPLTLNICCCCCCCCFADLRDAPAWHGPLSSPPHHIC